MGCEAHGNTDDRTFECPGSTDMVFDPYFVDAAGVEYPHWNGAPAFQDPKKEIPTTTLPTKETVLTGVPGRLQLVEVAVGLIAARSEQ